MSAVASTSAAAGASAAKGGASGNTSLADDDRFFSSLEQASNTVKAFLQEDTRWPDLAEHLSAAQYQYKLQVISPWAPLERRRVWSIPDAVIEASSSAETFASQGLFPEIQRAWIVIDTRLYLWNYADASHDAFESYEHPERVIQSVGLVKPKAGVFIDSIKHVLVVCTSTSVTLLGLALEEQSASANGASAGSSSASAGGPSIPNPSQSIKLFVTEMSVSTDGVQMTNVCGTESGRIFCRGNDGCLYEVLYQANEGWFSNRCSLRNITSPRLTNLVPTFLQSKQKESLDLVTIDSARNTIYTLHKGVEIEVHHMSAKEPSKPPTMIARAKDICRHANMMCPNTPLLQPNDFVITCMTPLSASESRSIHLVATTSKGVRLYFTTQRTGWRAMSSYGSSSSSSDPSAPTCLELVYVRPPPSAGQTQSVEGGMSIVQAQQQSSSASLSSTEYALNQPAINGVHHALYADGIFLAASQYSQEQPGSLDCILGVVRATPSEMPRSIGVGMSASSVSLSNTQVGAADLADTATDLIVQGATWAIAEVTQGRKAVTPDERIHPLALQMMQPRRVFLVLTSSGLFVLTEQRPVDTLKGLLQVGTLYDQTVHEFFKKYGQAQSCAMSLAIATRNTLLSVAPESFATGNSRDQGQNADKGVSQWLTPDVISHAWRIFFDFGGYPRYDPPPYPSQPASDGKVTLSGRHDGLAIYMTRLLQPFWTQKITRKEIVPGEGERQIANVTSAFLLGPQRELRSLQTFLQENGQLFSLGSNASRQQGLSGRQSLGRQTNVTLEGDQVALQSERDSFSALQGLLSRSLEALSFVLLLFDYRISSLVQRCKPEVQAELANLTFADLTSTRRGRDVGRALVEAVIDLQITSQVSIDVVADVLQERCGGFCNADDVRLYKALECVRRAKEAAKTGEQNVKNEMLRESLRLLNRATATLPMEKLESICADYRELSFYHGAVELPLKCAASWDRGNAAQRYRADGHPSDDPRGKIYEVSMRCYGLVLAALLNVDAHCASDAVVKAKENGQHDVVRHAEEQRTNTYALAQASQDPLFHVAMYDWLLSQDKTDDLLQVRSPYVEEYLRSEPVTLERCLLLCLWYVSVGHSFSAAQLYAGLAQSTELDISLEDRVEYLTKASSNAKATYQTNSQELIQFISDVDEKLEVASVQIELYKSIQESLEIDDEHKTALMAVLNENLLDITALYREFAEPLGMHEIKLLVYHVSDHRDVELVRQCWEALISEAHNDALALPDTRHEKVAAVVIELGHRFYPSEVAFPVDILTEMLERYAIEQSMNEEQTNIPSAWAPKTMLLAHVPPQPIFDVLLGILDTRFEPFQTAQGQLFVLSDLAALARTWVDEMLGVAMPSMNIKDLGAGFSVRRFDEALSGLLLVVGQLEAQRRQLTPANLPENTMSIDKVTASFKATQELLRRSF